jgi:putative sterol carrier protein
MADPGSDEWVAALAARADGVAVDAGEPLVVQQEIVDTGRCWHVVVAGGALRVAAGAHPAPDVTFSQDAGTADAIASGELSAQQAFVEGRLRVRGAVGRLPETASAFAALGR